MAGVTQQRRAASVTSLRSQCRPRWVSYPVLFRLRPDGNPPLRPQPHGFIELFSHEIFQFLVARVFAKYITLRNFFGISGIKKGRRKASFLFFSRQVKLAGDYLAAPICPVMRGVFGGLHLYLSHLSVCFSRLSTSRTTSVGIIFSSFSTLRQRDSSAEMWARC